MAVQSLEPAARGTVAQTWIAHSLEAAFFVKAVPIGRYSGLLERAVPIQHRLWRAGFSQMGPPIPTRSGALTFPLGDHILAVYAVVPGFVSFDFPVEPFADLLAALHGTAVDVDGQVETFEIDAVARAEPVVAAALVQPEPDPLILAARETLDLIAPTLERDKAEARQARDALRRRALAGALPMVVTHYDAHHNVMIAPDGRLNLVDWDELMLAPRERDTWTQLVQPHRATRFLERYRDTAPNYEPDIDALRHYVLTWYFEEIEGLLAPMLDSAVEAETRARYLGWFQSSVEELHEVLRRLERGERPWEPPHTEDR